MTLVWTAAIVILLLLPGVFFFIGLWSRERHSKEIVRAGAIGEVRAAIFIAIMLHGSWWFLHWAVTKFSLADNIAPFWVTGVTPGPHRLTGYIRELALYTVILALLGWLAGLIVAGSVVSGTLRRIATHKWVYDVLKQSEIDHEKKLGPIRAYVMTKVQENNRVLMYGGEFGEFFLDSEGCFSYIVLKNCFRFYMIMEGDLPITSDKLPLLAKDQSQTSTWNFLMIHGENINNILFDRIPYQATEEDTRELIEAVEKRRIS